MNQNALLNKLMRTDLNLLTVLHALLETGSTQNAADRIGRTQSAVSHALKRLRYLFNDPLFVRNGPKLVPTKHAQQLKQPLAHLLHDITGLIERGVNFDPATTDREIVIATLDIALTLAMSIGDEMRKVAPNLRIRMVGLGQGATLLLDGEVDLVIDYYKEVTLAGLELTHVANLDWGVFSRTDHSISHTPSVKEWAKYEHIQVSAAGIDRNPIGEAAAILKVKRKVSMQVNNFLQALYVVSQSDLLLTTMVPLATPFAQQLGLRKMPLPLDVPAVPMCITTRATLHDPLSAWISSHALKALKTTF